MSAPWSGARIAELSRLRAQGLSATECGKRLGVSRSAVCGMLFRQRNPYKPRTRKTPAWWAEARAMRADGHTLQFIADLMGRSNSAVSIACRPVAIERRRVRAFRWRAEHAQEMAA